MVSGTYTPFRIGLLPPMDLRVLCIQLAGRGAGGGMGLEVGQSLLPTLLWPKCSPRSTHNYKGSWEHCLAVHPVGEGNEYIE